jgi:hypothetical protein
MTQALQRVLERLAGVLQRVHLSASAPDDEPGNPETPPVRKVVSNAAAIPPNQHAQRRLQLREKRKALFEAVKAAHQRGLTKRAVSREFGITRTTVRGLLKADEFPERAPRQRQSELIAFGNTSKNAGQRAATTRPNSAASCASRAMAVNEAV